MLAHPAPDHGGRYVSVAAFPLNLAQHAQHDPFLAGKSVAQIGKLIVAHLNAADASCRLRLR